MAIVTKNALVLRDLDILQPMAAQNLVHVNISLTTLDADLARSMEPRTSTPLARLRAIRELSAAGVPVARADRSGDSGSDGQRNSSAAGRRKGSSGRGPPAMYCCVCL